MQAQTGNTKKNTGKTVNKTKPDAQSTSVAVATVTAVTETIERQTPCEVHLIDLSLIDVNPYNARQSHDPSALQELADSIIQIGILHPITVRVIGERYQIVCGERRFMASMVAEQHTICAFVGEFTDLQMMEVALAENIQRRNFTYMEESSLFDKYICASGYTVDDIATKVGQSTGYVRNRLQLRNLVEEIGLMLSMDQITLGVALEISKYSAEIQQDVFLNHFDPEDQHNWQSLSTKEFRERMERAYSTALDYFKFPKDECATCQRNSASYDLFAGNCEGCCGNCQDMKCLMAKHVKYMVAACDSIAKSDPLVNFSVKPGSNAPKEIFEQLEAKGFEIMQTASEAMPSEPKPSAYSDDRGYTDAMENYQRAIDEIDSLVTCGIAMKLVDLSGYSPRYSYLMLQQPQTSETSEDKPKAGRPKTVKVQAEENIQSLMDQDARNKQLSGANTVDDVKTFIIGANVSAPVLNALELQALYFVLLSSLSPLHCKDFGAEGQTTLTDEQKRDIATSITPEQITMICRDFIIRNLCNTSGDCIKSNLLIDVASLHFPGEVGNIRRKYDEVYTKRRSALEARIEALRAKTKQPETEVVATGIIVHRDEEAEYVTSVEEPGNESDDEQEDGLLNWSGQANDDDDDLEGAA